MRASLKCVVAQETRLREIAFLILFVANELLGQVR